MAKLPHDLAGLVGLEQHVVAVIVAAELSTVDVVDFYGAAGSEAQYLRLVLRLQGLGADGPGGGVVPGG